MGQARALSVGVPTPDADRRDSDPRIAGLQVIRAVGLSDVVRPPSTAAATVGSRRAARARQRGSVLMPAGSWTGADLTVEAVRGVWAGLGSGRGRLRCRELTIRAHGRGAASVPREVTLWLPAPTGLF